MVAVKKSVIVIVVLLKTRRSTSRMGPRCHIFNQASVSIWSTRKGGSMP